VNDPVGEDPIKRSKDECPSSHAEDDQHREEDRGGRIVEGKNAPNGIAVQIECFADRFQADEDDQKESRRYVQPYGRNESRLCPVESLIFVQGD